MTFPEIETIVNKRILLSLDGKRQASKQESRRYLRLLCPVCRIKIQVGDKVVRVTTGKYVHSKCLSLFRVDSDIEISDKELDDFFAIKES
jgi:hypothetical protein